MKLVFIYDERTAPVRDCEMENIAVNLLTRTFKIQSALEEKDILEFRFSSMNLFRCIIATAVKLKFPHESFVVQHYRTKQQVAVASHYYIDFNNIGFPENTWNIPDKYAMMHEHLLKVRLETKKELAAKEKAKQDDLLSKIIGKQLK